MWRGSGRRDRWVGSGPVVFFDQLDGQTLSQQTQGLEVEVEDDQG